MKLLLESVWSRLRKERRKYFTQVTVPYSKFLYQIPINCLIFEQLNENLLSLRQSYKSIPYANAFASRSADPHSAARATML